MRRLILYIIGALAIIGCTKEDAFDLSEHWWGNDTLWGAKEISIRFISDTEFEFRSEDYLGGRGKYHREGTHLTFDFETHTIGWGQSYIKFISGEWNRYPTQIEDTWNGTELKLKYQRWFNMSSDTHTDVEEKEETLSITSRYE